MQHHPEASPGPRDSHYLFRRFVEMMQGKTPCAAQGARVSFGTKATSRDHARHRTSKPRGMEMNWREFWNGTHSIYVNERHRALHYDRIAKDIASLVPSADACVLDYGCGEAESAGHCRAPLRHALPLRYGAQRAGATARLRFGRNDKIVVLSSEALEAMTRSFARCLRRQFRHSIFDPQGIRGAARSGEAQAQADRAARRRRCHPRDGSFRR